MTIETKDVSVTLSHKEIVKKVFALAEKYHKPVYAVVSTARIEKQRKTENDKNC